ncbi:hypothetical protein NL676_013891 [Syzygium grande]|nr:hypothetical protein NL676_013891 [Syzygium grande]
MREPHSIFDREPVASLGVGNVGQGLADPRPGSCRRPLVRFREGLGDLRRPFLMAVLVATDEGLARFGSRAGGLTWGGQCWVRPYCPQAAEDERQHEIEGRHGSRAKATLIRRFRFRLRRLLPVCLLLLLLLLLSRAAEPNSRRRKSVRSPWDGESGRGNSSGGPILEGESKGTTLLAHPLSNLRLLSIRGLRVMGAAGSKLEKALGDQFPEGERYFGLENFGNTCYCNSVLQALYFCVPFRDQLLDYYANNKIIGDEDNLLACLADLFTQISSQKKKTGVIAPKRFVQRLKKQNELFRSYMHQDAHEFLNFLLNEIVDTLEKEAQAAKNDQEASSPSEKTANGPKNAHANGGPKEQLDTWVHKNFQGILTNETRCLRSTETLNAEDKFFCDKCCSLQEAQKRMKIKKPPQILVIHLKRFKYIEQLGRYKKLSYRVVFPLELKLSNTVEDADSEYSLFAVVVHVGSGPNHGHYVSLVKSHNHWLFFDDENVEMIDESAVQTFFGSAQEYSSNTDHGYILFYERLGNGHMS